MSTDSTIIAAPAAPVAPAVVINGRVRIPAGVGDLEAFRRWARSEECPEHVRLAYLAGTLWVDLTLEELFSHNQVKGEVARVLHGLCRLKEIGRYFMEGVLLSNVEAELSFMPAGAFISYATFRSGRIRPVPGPQGGVVELAGTPDLVLDVLSDASVLKDTVLAPELYRRAGIPEVWRVDARGELRFEIFRLTDAGYVPTQEPDGWWRSDVFGQSFRLTQQADAAGQPDFTLEVQP
jgi:hypothetical protein